MSSNKAQTVPTDLRTQDTDYLKAIIDGNAFDLKKLSEKITTANEAALVEWRSVFNANVDDLLRKREIAKAVTTAQIIAIGNVSLAEFETNLRMKNTQRLEGMRASGQDQDEVDAIAVGFDKVIQAHAARRRQEMEIHDAQEVNRVFTKLLDRRQFDQLRDQITLEYTLMDASSLASFKMNMQYADECFEVFITITAQKFAERLDRVSDPAQRVRLISERDEQRTRIVKDKTAEKDAAFRIYYEENQESNRGMLENIRNICLICSLKTGDVQIMGDECQQQV